jgi:alcohol dehydrogenase class IV
MTISKFAFPTTIYFGPGASNLVADHSGGRRRTPLIVTDRALAACR